MARSFLQDRIYRGDEIADCPHGSEIVCRNLAASQSSQAIQQVDGVDAVDLQVFVESRFERNPLGVDFEQLDQR